MAGEFVCILLVLALGGRGRSDTLSADEAACHFSFRGSRLSGKHLTERRSQLAVTQPT